jgi:hypothetical protein
MRRSIIIAMFCCLGTLPALAQQPSWPPPAMPYIPFWVPNPPAQPLAPRFLPPSAVPFPMPFWFWYAPPPGTTAPVAPQMGAVPQANRPAPAAPAQVGSEPSPAVPAPTAAMPPPEAQAGSESKSATKVAGPGNGGVAKKVSRTAAKPHPRRVSTTVTQVRKAPAAKKPLGKTAAAKPSASASGQAKKARRLCWENGRLDVCP